MTEQQAPYVVQATRRVEHIRVHYHRGAYVVATACGMGAVGADDAEAQCRLLQTLRVYRRVLKRWRRGAWESLLAANHEEGA